MSLHFCAVHCMVDSHSMLYLRLFLSRASGILLHYLSVGCFSFFCRHVMSVRLWSIMMTERPRTKSEIESSCVEVLSALEAIPMLLQTHRGDDQIGSSDFVAPSSAIPNPVGLKSHDPLTVQTRQTL